MNTTMLKHLKINMIKFLLKLELMALIIAIPGIADCQISGKIGHSVASRNGRNEENIVISALPGINIQAYGKSSSGKYELITQTQSDNKGDYFLDIPEGTQVKLVFGKSSGSLQSSPLTPSVRFIKSPANDVNWIVDQPARYVSLNPYLASPIYINGKGADSLSALLALSLDDTVSISLASSKQVGALWAVTYNKWTKQLYSAALAKRHVGYGPLGTGGIYRTDWATHKTTNWLDLKTLGIPTGEDHHENLKSAVDTSNIDAKMMADVGKVSLGGMAISEDGTVLYVMNLYNRTLYGIKLPSDTASKPSAGDVTAYTLPPSVCNGGTSRPFAINVYSGSVFIGVVCDAQISQSIADLTATVYKLDAASKKFTSVFTTSMDYQRGKAVNGLEVQSWYPWTDDFSKALHDDFPSTATRPQPILSSIAFDGSGSMILGFMDRFGHQSGTGQPDPWGKSSYSGVAAGDVLRVYARKPGNSDRKFSLENNGNAADLTSEGKDNLQGPKGGEFFYQDGFTFKDAKRNARTVHEETGAGGVIILPGTEEVLMTAHEPTDKFNSGGVKSFFNEDGKTSRGWLLYKDGQKGTFGKSNGIGGLALISGLPSIAAGNRVWIDANGDGIQDPDESPLANVELELWEKDIKKASTRSDAEGNYLFSEENLSGGLKPETEYSIRVGLAENQLRPTISKASTDVEIDNNGVKMDNYAVSIFKTGKPGEHVHDIDFGFLQQNPESGRGELIAAAQLTVYPNPVIKDVEVQMNASTESAILKLFNLEGREIMSKELFAIEGQYRTTLKLTQQPAGSYIISIDENGQVISKTIVKQ